VISPETRMMGLPYGEEIMIVGRTMWTQSTSVTDGRTDRRTDRITITKTVQRIASHGNYNVLQVQTECDASDTQCLIVYLRSSVLSEEVVSTLSNLSSHFLSHSPVGLLMSNCFSRSVTDWSVNWSIRSTIQPLEM